jgi:hypothetical protein
MEKFGAGILDKHPGSATLPVTTIILLSYQWNMDGKVGSAHRLYGTSLGSNPDHSQYGYPEPEQLSNKSQSFGFEY